MSDDKRLIRGCVLVICNSFADAQCETKREQASECDGDTMKELWGDILECHSFSPDEKGGNKDFFVHYDKNANEMMDLFTKFASYQSDIRYSYVAVVISTHGGMAPESWVKKWEPKDGSPCQVPTWKDLSEDYQEHMKSFDAKGKPNTKEQMVEVFFGNDFRPIREEQMKKLFNNDAAEGLRNVPKFFILSYCRGRNVDYGVDMKNDIKEDGGAPGSQKATSEQPKDEKIIPPIMPTISDVLVVYASHRLYKAYRGGSDFGSWLVTTVGKVFKKYAKKLDAVSMLTIVNRKMKKKEGEINEEKRKAMSIYESSLVNNLYLCDEAKIRGDLQFAQLKDEVKLEADKNGRGK